MTNSSYQTADSIPLSAVMAGLVVLMPMSHSAGQVMLAPIRITPGIRPSYVLGNAGLTIHVRSAFTADPVVDNYRPRTELGRKLIALRRAYVTTGGQLLDADGLDIEMQLRRGGAADA